MAADRNRVMKTFLTYAITSFLLLGAGQAAAEASPERAIAILAPSDRQTVFDDEGAVVVSLAPVPPLADGEFIVVRVDEQVVVLPEGLTRFAVTDVPAGAHVIAAMIVDADSKPLSAPRVLTFQVGAGSRS
jgi:hypothetical protein